MVAKVKITRYFRVNCNATFIKKKKMKPRHNNNNIKKLLTIAFSVV